MINRRKIIGLLEDNIFMLQEFQKRMPDRARVFKVHNLIIKNRAALKDLNPENVSDTSK